MEEEIGETIPAGVRTGVCDHTGIGRRLLLPGPKLKLDTLRLAREAAWATQGMYTPSPRKPDGTAMATPRRFLDTTGPGGDPTLATPLTHNQRTHNKEALTRTPRTLDVTPVPPYILRECCNIAPEDTPGHLTFHTTYHQKMCTPAHRSNRPFSAPTAGIHGGLRGTKGAERNLEAVHHTMTMTNHGAPEDAYDSTALVLQQIREASATATPRLRINATHVGAGGYSGSDSRETHKSTKHDGWVDEWTTTYRELLCPGWNAPRNRAQSAPRVRAPKWDGRRPRTVGSLAPNSARRPIRGKQGEWRA
mmetsp:Transcript_55102/g.131315  ORF Transcript_55102/g.131315 Transcript_55102/m.131315 type:complete len:306 (+) Transcript_55102:106-1023(+)